MWWVQGWLHSSTLAGELLMFPEDARSNLQPQILRFLKVLAATAAGSKQDSHFFQSSAAGMCVRARVYIYVGGVRV